jgi:hypothetical protein
MHFLCVSGLISLKSELKYVPIFFYLILGEPLASF